MIFDDFLMVLPWFSIMFQWFSMVSHDFQRFSPDSQWSFYVRSMFFRFPNGISLVFNYLQWFEKSSIFQRFFNALSMNFRWCVQDFLGFSKDVQWFFNDVSLVFQWYFGEFSRIVTGRLRDAYGPWSNKPL